MGGRKLIFYTPVIKRLHKTDVLNSILGNDTNSLLTVGRVTDNSISVRLGAARQATAGYAMLPRTHNITLLVMAPEDIHTQKTKSGDRNAKIRVTAKWNARHVLTGKLLPEFSPSAVPADVAAHLEKMIKGDLEPDFIDVLIGKVYANEPAAFDKELSKTKLQPGVHKRDVFVHIVERLQRQPTLGARFELPVLRSTELPDKSQTALLLDNGSSKTSVTLRGGAAMRADEISGYLGVTLKDGSRIGFQSENSSVTRNGSSLNLNFPSLASWKVRKLKKKGALLDGSYIEVHSKSQDRYAENITSLTQKYSSLMYKHAEAKEREYVDVSRTSVKVTQNKGAGSVDLHVKFDKSDPNDLATQVTFTVDGAEIDKVEKISPNTAIAVSSGAFSLSGDQSVRVTLKNMEPGSSFTIKAQPKDSTGAKLGKEKPYSYAVNK